MYQRVDSGEIVVAHRGTEQIWKDGVVTDGAMVLSRINPQVDDAIELTRRALAIAKEQGRQPGKNTRGHRHRALAGRNAGPSHRITSICVARRSTPMGRPGS